MSNLTLPSRMMPFNVYVQDDGCILNIDWGNSTYSIYTINDAGVVINKIDQSSVPYEPKEGEEDNVYYEDYVNIEVIQKIITLATVYSYETIIFAFDSYSKYFTCEDVNFQDFDMPHAYMFSDYNEVLSQLYEFTEDEVYIEKLGIAKQFFDEYFYEFSRDQWNEDDKEKIRLFFKEAINFLQNSSIH